MKFGNTNIGGMSFGSTRIGGAKYGNTLVFQSGGQPQPTTNNVAGMYDTYNDVFYPSASGTAFIAGPEL